MGGIVRRLAMAVSLWADEVSEPSEPAKKPEIAKVRYTHDAIIDEILVNPAISQGELAKNFGFTQAWISIIVNSDAFQERLRERKGELVDPKLVASIEARLDALARVSLDALLKKVEQHDRIPLKTMELVSIAKLGTGDRANRPAAPLQQNNLYVVALPPQANNSREWMQSAQGRKLPPGSGEVIDINPGV